MAGKQRVGLAGVGLMGHGIAANILKGGYPLAFLDHPGNRPVDDLLAAGAGRLSDAARLAAVSDVIILCVTGSPQVEDVLMREGGLLAGLRAGCVVIDCSTAVPSSTVRAARAVEAAGGRFLDAPMTRTPKEAEEGRLNLLVGGDAAVLEEVRPLLACFAENIAHVGPVGSGHRMKLLHNFVSLGFSAVLAEAAACARRSGIDPGVFVDVLAQGGGDGVVLRRLAPFIRDNDPSGFVFSLANANKDMGYYATMAREAEARHDVASAVRKLYDSACAAGHAQDPVPRLIAILEGDPEGIVPKNPD